jgi:hypothetical protein
VVLFGVLECGYSLVAQTESDPGDADRGNRLLHALFARRWVGDGDRTRDIQVHNLASARRVELFREQKRQMTACSAG